MDHHHDMDQSASTLIEYVKFAGIVSFIVVASLIVFNVAELSSAPEFARVFMGVFMVVFAIFKLIGYKMFVIMFAGYDLIAKNFKPYSYAYPFIELFLGVAALVNILPTARSWAVIAVMGIGAIGVFQEIYHRRSGVYCACLGNVIKLPLSTVSLVEDLGMVALASYMLLA